MGFKGRGAYLLPDDPNPGQYWTVCAYIPKDIRHLEAFWASLAHLAQWTAWETDPAKRAAQAAQAWKIANELTRSNWMSGGECDVPCAFRQNPDDPCQLEYSQDGGETWLLMFDYSLCPTYAPPYPGEPPGANECAAGALLAWLMALIETVWYYEDQGWNNFQIQKVVQDTLVSLDPSFSEFTGVALWVDVTREYVGAARDEVLDQCTWKDAFDAIAALVNADGTLPSDWCEQLLNVWEILPPIVGVSIANLLCPLSTSGLNRIVAIMGDNFCSFASACGGAACGDSYDFTVSDGGWTLREHPDPEIGLIGEYVPAVGWRSQIDGVSVHTRLYFRSPDFPAGCVITRVEVTYTRGGPAGAAGALHLKRPGTPDQFFKTFSLQGNAGTLVWTGTEAIPYLVIGTNVGTSYHPITITSIVIEGVQS